MRYASGSSFRQALEAHLRDQSRETGAPLTRLRKLVSFDRLLARLVQAQPGRWVLKGGLSLQLRLGDRARTTKDIDLLLLSAQDPFPILTRAAKLDLGDWFTLEVAPCQPPGTAEQGGLRYPARALLDGRIFEEFHVDVGIGDPMVESEDILSGPALLSFAGLEPTKVPCFPPSQQIAEKLHAYTRPHAGSSGTRVRDLVDMLLIASLCTLSAANLRSALHATFEARRTHPLPRQFPMPPSSWVGPYRRLAREVGLERQNLAEAADAVSLFLNPVLQGTPSREWDPSLWIWH